VVPPGANADRSMDDLVLKAAIWQDEHWVDRSSMLKVDSPSVESTKTAEKVVFLSLGRNRKFRFYSAWELIY
jgi:protein SMG6